MCMKITRLAFAVSGGGTGGTRRFRTAFDHSRRRGGEQRRHWRLRRLAKCRRAPRRCQRGTAAAWPRPRRHLREQRGGDDGARPCGLVRDIGCGLFGQDLVKVEQLASATTVRRVTLTRGGQFFATSGLAARTWQLHCRTGVAMTPIASCVRRWSRSGNLSDSCSSTLVAAAAMRPANPCANSTNVLDR